jgi:hypothetical protein
MIFLRDPKHWLPIVGAFIVFITFIVKDGLHERWKDTADAFESAERFASQKQMSKGILEAITALSTKKTPSQIAFSAIPFQDEDENEQRWDEQINKDTNLALRDLMNTWSDADNLEILLNLLPPEDSAHVERKKGEHLYDETNDLIATIDKKHTAYGEAQHALLRTEDYRQAIKELKKKTADELAPLNERLDNELINVSAQAYSLQTATLDHAKAIRERNRLNEKYAKWISAALFGLGWGLGLLGKFYGVPEVAGGGD